MRRSQRIKRSNRAEKYADKLVYKRTEIDEPSGFSISKFYYPLVVISCLGILYLMFFSGVFKVTDISIKGVRELNPDELKVKIQDKLSKQFFKNNIIFFDSDSLTREAKKQYALKTLKINKQYPSKISVTLEEYILELQWFSNNNYYFIDEKGKAVGESQNKKDNIPIIYDKKNLPVVVGKSMVTTDFINFIKTLNQKFTDTTGAKISRIEINESFNEIIVYSSLGYYIVFDTTRDPNQELKNLQTVIESKEIKSKKLTYLDMRIKNKVFYK